ncbi:unnamed protein product, partial [marine sediment metagenome]
PWLVSDILASMGGQAQLVKGEDFGIYASCGKAG